MGTKEDMHEDADRSVWGVRGHGVGHSGRGIGQSGKQQASIFLPLALELGRVGQVSPVTNKNSLAVPTMGIQS